MRALCLLLIVANLAFLGWTQLVDAGPSQQARVFAPPPVAQRLQLASEAALNGVASAGNGAASALPDEASSAEKRSVADSTALPCRSVGPFRDLAEAAHASGALQAAGFDPRQRLEQGELWVGYWVSLQDLRNRAAADEAMSKLKDHGVTDAYIMPSTDSASVLSLGVFTDQSRAQRRAEEIRGFGFDPQISDRKRSGTVYWLDVDNHDGKPIDPALLQAEPGKILRLEMRACPAT
jgi:hypothetical protein